jgi:hypothetical protein
MSYEATWRSITRFISHALTAPAGPDTSVYNQFVYILSYMRVYTHIYTYICMRRVCVYVRECVCV